MRRRIQAGGLLLVLTLVLSLPACGGQQSTGKSLYDQGLEVVQLMAEMARSEDYVALYSGSSDVQAILERAGQGDFTAPQAVYRLTVPTSAFLALAGEETDLDLSGDLTPAVQKTVEDRLQPALAAQFNAQAGTTALAAASICAAEKLFVSSELKENTLYLYTFEDAVPAAVSFTAGEDGAVSASGVLILNDAFSKDRLTQYAAGLGVTVEEVAP